MKFFGMKFNDLFKYHDVFNDDLRKSANTTNPTIFPDIDMVFVLSGRATVLGADADNLKRPYDSLDDLERLQEGIRVAKTVNALRARKELNRLTSAEHVTPIFYNGRAIHNQHLRQALKEGLLDYPEELFIIRDIFPKNTIGQIQSLKEYIAHNQHTNVAVVSSGYHLARVARAIGQDSPQSGDDHAISRLNIFLFGVHKNEKRPGIVDDLYGEYDAMRRYSSGVEPSISRLQSKNVFFNEGESFKLCK